MVPPVPPQPATVPVAAAVHSGREFWIVLFASWLLSLLVKSLRIRVEDPYGLLTGPGNTPHIYAFWHNRLLLVPVIWQRVLRRGRPHGVALTSRSRDGELIARFLERFGITPVRGSAARGGSGALRELARWLRQGHDVGITPDGSRGPRYEMKPGLVLLAQLSGRAVLPMSFEFSSAWRTRSWDRFFIPKPFSRVTFLIGEPVVVRRTDSPEAFEAERVRCEEAMRRQVRED